MRFVLVEHHQVGTQVFFLRNGVFITEPVESRFTLPDGNQAYTQGIETLVGVVVHAGHIDAFGQCGPFLSGLSNQNGDVVALVLYPYRELSA